MLYGVDFFDLVCKVEKVGVDFVVTVFENEWYVRLIVVLGVELRSWFWSVSGDFTVSRLLFSYC